MVVWRGKGASAPDSITAAPLSMRGAVLFHCQRGIRPIARRRPSSLVRASTPMYRRVSRQGGASGNMADANASSAIVQIAGWYREFVVKSTDNQELRVML